MNNAIQSPYIETFFRNYRSNKIGNVDGNRLNLRTFIHAHITTIYTLGSQGFLNFMWSAACGCQVRARVQAHHNLADGGLIFLKSEIIIQSEFQGYRAILHFGQFWQSQKSGHFQGSGEPRSSS